jgi:hypothetical protein
VLRIVPWFLGPLVRRGENLWNRLVVRIDIDGHECDEHNSREFASLFTFKELPHSLASDLSGRFVGESVDTCADSTESNGLHAIVDGNFQTLVITLGKALFRGLVHVVDRSDGVDNMLGGEVISLGNDSVASLNGTKWSALLSKLGTCSGMDGAIDAGTAKESLVGSIDDGIELQLGDVSLDQADAVIKRGIRSERARGRFGSGRGERRARVPVELGESGNIVESSGNHCDESSGKHESARGVVG